MFTAHKAAAVPELKDFSVLGEAPEYHSAYHSGVAVLESFLSRCARPDQGVYALFAQDPAGRLRYVCSSERTFDRAGFPAEIERWPTGAASQSGSTGTTAGSGKLNGWIPGLPDGGATIWRCLGSSQSAEGLLLLWWPGEGADERVVHGQFEATLGLAEPFFRIWQNNRRHESRYHRLKALEELSLAVASSLDLQDVLSRTHDAVVNALGFERAAIYVLDEDGHTLRGAWATDDGGDRISISDRTIDLAGNNHPAALVARGEYEFFVADRSANPGHGANGHAPPRVSSPAPLRFIADPEAVVPMRAGGGVVGVIEIGAGALPSAMREEHLRVMLPFAAHAGAAVHNARMHEKLASHLRRTEELELQRSNFEREVILSVTEGKLSLCEADEIPAMLGQPLASTALATAGDVARCRQIAVKAALEAGLSPDRKSDFELCLGEAATNCYQHAGGGDVEVYRKGDRVQFRIRDSGPGIQSFVLPRAMLLKGYSTTTSLGMGFSLMLSLSDRLYLATSTVRGTDMLIEMAMQQTSEIERIWEQFGFLSDQAA